MKELLLEYGTGLLGMVSVIAVFRVLNLWFAMEGLLSRIISDFLNSLGG